MKRSRFSASESDSWSLAILALLDEKERESRGVMVS